MTPKNTIALEAHLQAKANVGKLPKAFFGWIIHAFRCRPKTCLAIAAILYEGTPPENLRNLEEIEKTVRQKVLKHVSPEIGVFLFKQSQVQPQAEKDA